MEKRSRPGGAEEATEEPFQAKGPVGLREESSRHGKRAAVAKRAQGELAGS